jgi:hypothetical protein
MLSGVEFGDRMDSPRRTARDFENCFVVHSARLFFVFSDPSRILDFASGPDSLGHTPSGSANVSTLVPGDRPKSIARFPRAICSLNKLHPNIFAQLCVPQCGVTELEPLVVQPFHFRKASTRFSLTVDALVAKRVKAVAGLCRRRARQKTPASRPVRMCFSLECHTRCRFPLLGSISMHSR